MVHGIGDARPLDNAELQDLQTYATANGLNSASVEQSHKGIDEFSTLITELETTTPDSYVRGGMAPAGAPSGYWIQFSDMPDADTILRITALPVDVEIQYGAPASGLELATLAASLVGNLSDRPDVIEYAGASYDHVRRVMRLTYQPVAGLSDTLIRSVLHDALVAGTVGGELPLPVVLERTTGSYPVNEGTVQGGRDLNRDTGAAECTGGYC